VKRALVLLAVLACKQDPPKLERGALATVDNNVIELGGTISVPPDRDSIIVSSTTGQVARVVVAEGDRVETGSLLAVIDDASAIVAAQQAEANVEVAKAAGSQGALDTAHARAAEARAALARGEVRSPRNGVVVHVFRAAGESLDGTMPIARVADVSTLELHTRIAADALARVRPGMAARVTVRDGAAPVAGTVVYVAPAVDTTTGVGLVRIALASNAGIRVGASASARIEAGR
jgi:multidrug resistance efflux pump